MHSIEKYAFLFDFDGTLVDIADRPRNVAIPHELGPDLANLRRLAQNALAIVTGRRVAEIDSLLSPHCFDIAGAHGGEMRISSRFLKCPEGGPAEFRRAVARIRERFGNRTGLVVEDKGSSVAVHWRLDPALQPAVTNFLAEATAELGESHRVQLGKAVAEIVPRSVSKGKAMEIMLGREPYAGRTPLFIGDDLSDESGFEVVNRLGGESVHVGSGSTIAQHRLRDANAVRRRIAAWARGAAVDPESDFA